MKRELIMRSNIAVLLVSIGLVHGIGGISFAGKAAHDRRPVSFVNPMIGSGGHGHTYPGATVPFGMVQLSPDGGNNGWDWCSGYNYSDTGLKGFSHTHLSGTGGADLGDISLMPATSSKNLDENYRSPFSHDQEKAEAGFYTVKLLDHDITVELTATARAGFHRYTFPKSDSSRIIIDLKYGQDDQPTETYLKIESDRLVTGYRYSDGWAVNQKVFFAAKFSKPFTSSMVGSDDSYDMMRKESQGKGVKAVLFFSTDAKEVVLVKVGISAVSIEGALKNLDKEIADWNFDRIRKAAKNEWEKALRTLSVETSDTDLKETFYTALYHSMLAPTLYSDVDGRYRGADGKIHQSSDFKNYSTFSLWDTFRTAHPLYTLIQPERVNDMVNSMLAFYRESGYLPVWPLAGWETNTMIGYHSVPVIADAYFKGFRGFNVEEAFQAMKKSAEQQTGGLKYYSSAPASENMPTQPDSFWVQQIPQGNTIVVINGYNQSISGETIGYHSFHPQANQALLTRATSGKMSIAWDTDTIKTADSSGTIMIVWLAGMASGRGSHKFALSLNGEGLCSIHSVKDINEKEYIVKGKYGSTLSFRASAHNEYGDMFGYMVLQIPSSLGKAGQPFQIEVTGENAHNGDWYMTFMHPIRSGMQITNGYNFIRMDGIDYQYVRVDIEHLDAPKKIHAMVSGGKEIETFIGPGMNVVHLPLPVVKNEQKAKVTLAIEGKEPYVSEIVVFPVRPLGYIPADEDKESVSKTLEYAFDDWCIAQMAKALGKTDDYNRFSERAGYYKNLFDSATGFMRGRNLNGSWVTPFNPRYSTGRQPEYTEANAWQYLWSVQHDVYGLIRLLGGNEKFVEKLDSLFNQSSDLEGTGAPPDVSGLIGLYAQGNEPSHHVAYLYTYAGEPWKTQKLVRSIMKTFYKNTYDGLCGNEDCGQMSAWYVMSAIGLYPVNPAGGRYVLGSPIFPSVNIQGGNGKVFTLKAHNISEKNKYIQSATLNGKRYTKTYITHQDILAGGNLTIEMGEKPNSEWGTH